MFLIKMVNRYSELLGKPKILILAPNGVVAINIDGTSINSGFSISSYVN